MAVGVLSYGGSPSRRSSVGKLEPGSSPGVKRGIVIGVAEVNRRVCGALTSRRLLTLDTLFGALRDRSNGEAKGCALAGSLDRRVLNSPPVSNALSAPARVMLPTEESLHHGLAVLRWASLAWTAGVVAFGMHNLRHPMIAWGLVIAGAALAACTTGVLRFSPLRLSRPLIVLAQPAFGMALLIADGWVFRNGHVASGSQNLAASWPLLGVITAGIGLGPWVGLVCGAVVTAGRPLGALTNGVGHIAAHTATSYLSTLVFYALSGAMAGWITRLLRRVETEVLARRARDEVAMTLHDTVLQTLAVVVRRTATTDPVLADLARSTDRDLRAWLRDGPVAAPTDLAGALRRAAQLPGLAIEPIVNVVDDGSVDTAAWLDAFAGAAGEAVRNADKHANATRIVVYGEVDDGRVFVSVHDDGGGFDVADVPDGSGLAGSITARIAAIGGRTEINSLRGRGTEVKMWVG